MKIRKNESVRNRLDFLYVVRNCIEVLIDMIEDPAHERSHITSLYGYSKEWFYVYDFLKKYDDDYFKKSEEKSDLHEITHKIMSGGQCKADLHLEEV